VRRRKRKVSLPALLADGIYPSKLTYQIWGKDIASEVFKNKTLNKALTTKIIAQEA
jgi:hypothetical protein